MSQQLFPTPVINVQWNRTRTIHRHGDPSESGIHTLAHIDDRDTEKKKVTFSNARNNLRS